MLPGRWLLSGGCPPPSPLLPPLAALRSFFFLVMSAPPLSPAFLGFRPRVPWALALCVVFFFSLLPLGSLGALACFVSRARPLAAPWWLLPPPHSSPFVSCCRSLPWVFFFFVCAPPLSLAFYDFRPRVPWALARVLFVWWPSRCPALRVLAPRLYVPPGRFAGSIRALVRDRLEGLSQLVIKST